MATLVKKIIDSMTTKWVCPSLNLGDLETCVSRGCMQFGGYPPRELADREDAIGKGLSSKALRIEAYLPTRRIGQKRRGVTP